MSISWQPKNDPDTNCAPAQLLGWLAKNEFKGTDEGGLDGAHHLPQTGDKFERFERDARPDVISEIDNESVTFGVCWESKRDDDNFSSFTQRKKVGYGIPRSSIKSLQMGF